MHNATPMLKNHKLLTDKDCPMCQLYGQCFIKMNFLEEEGVVDYQHVDQDTFSSLDFDRARNEIALYDTASGVTTYGVDSVMKIITQNHPTMHKILSHPILYAPLKRLYFFISYNRKVIAPAKPDTTAKQACTPDLNIPYRWAYIVLVAIGTAFIVNGFTGLIFPHYGWAHSLWLELAVCFGQVAWQSVAIAKLAPDKRLSYLGNMSTVSMMGALVLLPITGLLSMMPFDLLLYLIPFFSVIGMMFIEHIRRCRLLEISKWMTASWVAYRVVALSLIIIINNV